MSLRARLLLGVVALVAVALAVAGAATYSALQSFLTAQLDDSLTSGAHSAFNTWSDANRGQFGPGPGFPPGTYMAVYSPSGRLLGRPVGITAPGSAATAAPRLPAHLAPGSEDHPRLLSVGGTGAVSHYRVAIETLDEAEGNAFVLAEPLTSIDATLARLLLLEAMVGGLALLATGALAWWLVRTSLRPLEDIGGTAAAIAAGDLTRRVEPANDRTEVGRLGLALNAMLAQIEASFQEQHRLQQQLRDFLADASHELRTPLTSIRGYAEMLRRGAEGSPDDAAVARRRIEEESVRMTALVDDLLLLARLDQGRPLETEAVDLAALAADACTDVGAVAPRRKITLIAPEPVVVNGDEARLRQVVGNLVRNAIVHTPARTSIEVAVARADGQAMLTVMDHGRGLTEDQARHVFEPFYRADPGRSRDRGGVGLGLSIVQAVVAAHRGRVDVEPTTGGGATFRVVLPL